MNFIKATTLADAWLQAANHLLRQPEWTDTTVVLHVETPTLVRASDAKVAGTLDAFLLAHDQYSNHTVAETIFPGYEYVRRGVDGVFEDYPNEIYPRIAELPEVKRWGTYAHRLLRRTDGNGKIYNPLKYCIEKMQDKVPKRACYELGFGFGFDLATYDDNEDRPDRMGGPCLSHLSFKLIGNHVHLTALYRFHYYVHRAYGNLLGLARLQQFVADQIDAQPGPLVCHSTLAILEDGAWKKNGIRELVAKCNGFAPVEPQAASLGG